MPDTFRKEYKPLTEGQKTEMAAIKEAAERVEELFNQVINPDERSEKSRCIAIAKTNLEQSIMWAIKGVTS